MFVIFFIDSSYQFFLGKNIFGEEYSSTLGRVSSFFGEEKILGSFISRFYLLLMFLIYFLFEKNNKKIFYILFFLVTIITGFITVISGERTALLYFLIGLVIFFK